MNKEEIEKYKIRDYYMIPVEIVDNIFYIFEQENKQLKEKIKNAKEYIKINGEKQYNIHDNYRGKWYSPDDLDNLLDILKGDSNE